MANPELGPGKKITRITIEAGGYRWRVHCGRDKTRWHCHLVEFLGGERRLDVKLNKRLLQQIREAVARQLGLEVAEVASIAADLILA
jgi:hypothetical protein